MRLLAGRASIFLPFAARSTIIYFGKDQLLRKFVSQNKAKNAGRSRKNAGMRDIHQNAGFHARLGMVDTYGHGLDGKSKSFHNVQVFKKCVKEQYLQTYDLN